MEQVEVIDANFNVLKIVSREEAYDKTLMIKSVFVIVRNSQGQYYAAQRKANRKLFPLKWGIGAGGAVKAGESFDDAAKREAKEELGIDIDAPKYIFDFSYSSEHNAYKGKVHVATYDGEIVAKTEEVEQGKWVTKEEVMQMIKENQLCPDTAEYIKIYFDKYASFD